MVVSHSNKLLTSLVLWTLCIEYLVAQEVTAQESSGAGCGTPILLANTNWKSLNGTVDDGTYIDGTVVVYSCDANFYATRDSGSGIFVCNPNLGQDDGWTGDNFTCSGSCDRPPTISNTAWMADDIAFSVGSNIMYKCDTDFYPTTGSGNGVLSCKKESLIWVGDTFVCSEASGCNTQPCLFGGTCEADTTTDTGFRCQCLPSYSGDSCQTADGGDPLAFFVSFTSNTTFTEAMKNQTSPTYLIIKTKLETEIGKYLASGIDASTDALLAVLGKDFQQFIIDSLEKGSTVVNGRALYDPTTQQSTGNLQERLRNVLTQLKQDHPDDPLYDIDPNSVTVTTTKPSATSNSLLAVWVIIGLVGILIIILLVLIFVWRARRRERNEGSSRSPDDTSGDDADGYYGSQFPQGRMNWPNMPSYMWREYPGDFHRNLDQSTLGSDNFSFEMQPTASYRVPDPADNPRFDWSLSGRGSVNMFNGGPMVGTSWHEASSEYF